VVWKYSANCTRTTSGASVGASDTSAQVKVLCRIIKLYIKPPLIDSKRCYKPQKAFCLLICKWDREFSRIKMLSISSLQSPITHHQSPIT